MLELLLNLIWGLIAAAAIGAWVRQKITRPQSSGRWTIRVEFCALCCALALLFPAISATDDLHAAQLAIEASDLSRKVLRGITPARTSKAAGRLHSSPALPRVTDSALRPVLVMARVVHSYIRPCMLPPSQNFENRAPPLLPLA